VQAWSCEWGTKEDSMLLVGVHQHGFGSWPLIEQDTPLELSGKFFLGAGKEEEKKSPKAIHLVRRADQMLKILAEQDKKNMDVISTNGKLSSSSSSKKGPRFKQQQRKEAEKHQKHKEQQEEELQEQQKVAKHEQKVKADHYRHKLEQDNYNNNHHANTNNIKSASSPTMKLEGNSKKRSYRSDDTTSRSSTKRAEKENKVSERGYESYDEDAAYATMRPVKYLLNRLRDDSAKAEGHEKAAIIKDCLYRIGKHIDREALDNRRNDSNMKRDLWLFTLKYWPGHNVTYKDLIVVYEKVVEAKNQEEKDGHHHSNRSRSSNNDHHNRHHGSSSTSSVRKDTSSSRRSSHSHHYNNSSSSNNNNSNNNSSNSNNRHNDSYDNNGSNNNRRRRSSSSSHRSNNDDHHRRDRKSYDRNERRRR
jgi:chromodomain-helicase-DNA-binding protein 1